MTPTPIPAFAPEDRPLDCGCKFELGESTGVVGASEVAAEEGVDEPGKA